MMKRWKWAIRAVATLLILAIAILITPVHIEIMAFRSLTKADVLLLDPGHGGIDGGAEGGGVCEKHINLSIAQKIRQMAEADGWTVVMTREEDKGLYPEKDRQSIRSLKTEDLLARRKIIEELKPLVAVSIHLNSFKQDPGVRGAQTFYPGSGDQEILDASKLLAETIQANLVEGLSDGTDRAALSKRDVLLFKNPVVPIVIVECGFLSNGEEAALLSQESYQRKVAECIYRGIMKYTGKEGRDPLQIIDNRG
ncbi:MAG: N-acetylmuramoyl-L-alanine amidase [Clostridiales bacterium]|nr:N-acetylmuramoyl-L-alanine amidase [Clostridiales bacterium]